MWRVRFVDSTEAARVTRLDLNSGDTAYPYVAVDGTLDLGQAALQRTLSNPEGRDGETVTSSKRTNREVRIPLRVHGNAYDFSVAMGRIARECDRRENLLEFWPDDEVSPFPVFFVVHQGEISEPNLEDAGAGIWTIELTLLCEPAAVGETVSGSVVVFRDPAHADGIVQELPAAVGDIPAPLLVRVLGGSVDKTGPALVNVASTDAPPLSARMVQAEALTQGTGATVQANDVAMSGAGSNFSRIAFTTNDLTSLRLSGSIAAVPHGCWRVWARLRKSVASNEFNLRFDNGDAVTTAQVGQVVQYEATAATGPHWVDLGFVGHPFHAPAIEGGSDAAFFRFFAERTSGTGTLDVDCFVLTPEGFAGGSHSHTAFAKPFDVLADSSEYLLLDPDQEVAWMGPILSPPSPIVGDHTFRIVPGETTLLTLLHRTYPGVANTIGSANTVEWEYAPRYLYVAAP